MIAATHSPASTDYSEADRIQQLHQTVSASRLNTWQSCRLKFYFRYVLKIKRAQSSAQYVGSMVHLVLQNWNMARWRKQSIQTEVFQQQFELDWQLKQQESPIRWDTDEEADAKKESWSLVETYLKNTPIQPDEMPEAVEVAVEADLSHHGLPRLIGIIDLVRQGGRIVDFKTTGQTPNPEKAGHLNETQLSCYSVLYRETTGSKEKGLELHHLVKLKTPKLVIASLPPMTEPQETKLFRIMESYQAGLERKDWIPSPSPMSCACCEYFNECRRWS
jgi:CRISPR/Cas system-associated exonuclease Cas4 (RecB family)